LELDQSRGGERIGDILLSGEDRNPHFTYDRVRHFVKHDEHHVAGDEFREAPVILGGFVLELLMLAESECGGVDARFEFLRVGGRRLRKRDLGGGHQSEREKKQHVPVSRAPV
jgi:hypothetical protein